MAGPRLLVDPPAFTPLSYGLLSVAQPQPTTDRHWQNGVTYEPLCSPSTTVPAGATTYDECITVTGTGAGTGTPPAPPSKTDNVDKPFRGATPFTVYTEFDCSAVGNADAQRRASDALSRAEPWQIERAFWTGLSGGQTTVWPHLAANAQVTDAQGVVLQTAAVTVTGGASPLHVVEALGLLEGALANCYDGVGVIHVPQGAVPTLDGLGLIHANGPVLKTMNGNLIAAGAGYPGTSPAGATPTAGTSWIYATGAVAVWRGGVRMATPTESFDRSENTMRMIAERTVVLGWDCCHFAAQVALSLPG